MSIYEHNIHQIKIKDTNVTFAVKDSMIWVHSRTTKIFILGRNLINASIVQLVLQAGGIIDSMKKLILEKVVNTIKNEVKYIQYKWAHKICELTNKYICPHCDKVLQKSYRLRTEIRGDFNIHGTKNFHNAVFHQKSKNYDVFSK